MSKKIGQIRSVVMLLSLTSILSCGNKKEGSSFRSNEKSEAQQGNLSGEAKGKGKVEVPPSTTNTVDNADINHQTVAQNVSQNGGIISCVKDHDLIGKVCVPVCAANQTRIGGLCVNNCTSTQEMVNNVCLEKCTDGQKREGDRCVNICSAGKELVNGICVDYSDCWIAISGTFLGIFGGDNGGKIVNGLRPDGTVYSNFPLPNFGDIFPNTMNNKPYHHGELFDGGPRAQYPNGVGGIYLRNLGIYEYGKLNKEIDRAVDSSFDSIAVSPGLQVILRDAQGRILFDEKGPYIGLSDEAGHSFVSPDNFTFDLLYNSTRVLPVWMKDYMSFYKRTYIDTGLKRGFKRTVGMHNTRKLELYAVPGGQCDKR